MTKILTNKIYLKKQLFSFKMNFSKTPEDNFDEFNKIIVNYLI